MPRSARVAARFCLRGLPAASAAVLTGLLAPVGVTAAAALAALAGVGAWTGSLRRRSDLLPAPGRFIGS